MIRKAQREDIPLIQSLAKQSWNSHYLARADRLYVGYDVLR
ncbi:hypothetical protein RA0C_0586 [Riemerella anatipestifer ATCC 11845 = DSM 15868]|uniref:Uncharacterized protein n=1 Tax=Riemerella anatipestifer (strain ATCC 11845 / DSM 15868 / JCM 9532 / NCTC 11014) TaxID=693978 RepID=H8MDT3_RIEAD|nr:hypothetical protein RA0C_0586 [Riemerella anatipestifer ATCC 11845 = DSM 15868]SNV54121.1 Uncharacterised protein [Riemerella anatipestifer]